MSDIQELLERVRTAEGPDQELDWLLAEHFGEVPSHRVIKVGFDYDWCRREGELTLWKALDAEGRSVTYWKPEPRTSSIDVALALVGRLLPGWSWSIDTMSVPPGDWSKVKALPHAQLAEPVKTKYGDGIGIRAQIQAATPALAILAALLSALIAQPNPGDAE